MFSWILASIVVALVAAISGWQDWTMYDIFTATALFAIFLKLKD